MEKQKFLEPNLQGFPDELKSCSQWVGWRSVIKDGKPTKIPINLKTGGYAAVDKPETWVDCETAEKALDASNGNLDGLGIVLTAQDPFCGLDIDKCRNPETGELTKKADKIIKKICSYTEPSPSNTGIRIFAKGKFPVDDGKTGSKKNGIEVYNERRFLTITGHRFEGMPETIKERQPELEELKAEYFSTNSTKPIKTPSATLPKDTDARDLFLQNEADQLTELKAKKSKFDLLWQGKWQQAGYPSHSEGDLALVNFLRHQFGPDPSRLDRLSRMSKMFRDKWDSRRGDSTYGWDTINKALESAEDIFEKAQKTGFDKISEKLGIKITEFQIRKYIASDTMYEISVLTDDDVEGVGLTAPDLDSQAFFRRKVMGPANKRIRRFKADEWDEIVEDLLSLGKIRWMSIDESDIGILWNIIHESFKTGDQLIRHDDPRGFIDSQAVIYTPSESNDEFLYLQMQWLRTRLSNEGFKFIAVNPKAIGKYLRTIGFGEPNTFRIKGDRGPNRWRIPLEIFQKWREAQTKNGSADPIYRDFL